MEDNRIIECIERAHYILSNLMAVKPGEEVLIAIDPQTDMRMPLRYNNDKRKKPLFSRGSRVCRHLFNSFSKLKSDEKNIKKRRLFH